MLLTSFLKSQTPPEEKNNQDQQQQQPVRVASEFTLPYVYQLPARPRRYVIAITGATGVALGVRMLEILSKIDGIETHVIVSKWGVATMKFETEYNMAYIRKLADKVYSPQDVTAPISSGSYQHDGMIVVPCSMKTLASIRIGYTDELITRAADVTLKEQRKLLLVTRETPLSSIHLENMKVLADRNVIIFPPVVAFYTKPQSVEDIVEQTVGRILDCFGINIDSFPRWNGLSEPNVVLNHEPSRN